MKSSRIGFVNPSRLLAFCVTARMVDNSLGADNRAADFGSTQPSRIRCARLGSKLKVSGSAVVSLFVASLCGLWSCARSAPLVMQVDTRSAPATANQPASGASTEPPHARIENREAWRAYMSKHPSPNKGCFKASYPSTQWQEVPCGPAPTRRY